MTINDIFIQVSCHFNEFHLTESEVFLTQIYCDSNELPLN